MIRQYKYAVFIGRMQPPHNGHIRMIELALGLADIVIVVLGSNRSAPNVRNPWSAAERIIMLESVFPCQWQRLRFISVRDYYYEENKWLTELQQKVREITGESKSICLVGHKKDRTSYYLDSFPQWDKKLDFPYEEGLNSTNIREQLFDYYNIKMFYNLPTPISIQSYLDGWCKSKQFDNLVKEQAYYKKYKEPYANLPFPVTFVTTDVVVIKSGHVLLIRRKVNPGKGLLALPGGFINQSEWVKDAAFRELKEETRIRVDKKVLKEHIVDEFVADHPDRSLRGRTISHTYCVKLPEDGKGLPYVKGGDDAGQALWMPFYDLSLHETEFFEDHLHIIGHFINKF